MLWNSLFAVPAHPKAVQGVLDLRHYNLQDSLPIALDGEWAFYPNKLLSPEEAALIGSPNGPGQSYISVPQNWSKAVPKTEQYPYQYGTYRLKVLVDDDQSLLYSMRFYKVYSAYKIFVGGRLAAEKGRPSESPDTFRAHNPPVTATSAARGQELEIIVQVAHNDYNGTGGITHSVKFGTSASVERQTILSVSMQIVMCVVLLMHALYAVILYLFKTRHIGMLYFIFFLLCTALSILLDDDKLLVSLAAINYEWSIKLILLSYDGLSAFMLLFVTTLFPYSNMIKALRLISVVCGIYALYIIAMPAQYVLGSTRMLLFLLVIPVFIVTTMIMRIVIRGDKEAIYFLMSAAAIASNMTWSVSKKWEMAPSTYYPFDIIAAVILFATFWLKRFLHTSEQRDKLADKLLKEDKMKDEFLANTSHELRNPLHGMLNIARSVLDNEAVAKDEYAVKDMELLITIGRRMTHTLGDLLDMTRLKERRVRLQRSSLKLQAIASSVFDMHRFMKDDKPIAFELDVSDSFPAVYADENRLIQILSNLVHNAMKYTTLGTVTIRAAVVDGMARVEVADTGIGMDEDTADKIFMPYEQGDSSMTAMGGGIGLGLYICKQLVELQGGAISVQSAPGEGSVFSFTLPLSGERSAEGDISVIPAATGIEHAVPPLAAAAGLQQTAASSANLPSILAVDDDPVNLKVLQRILPDGQYRIVTATSGIEALELLQSDSFQLVITDVMMPNMSGYRLTSIIRERFTLSELPILLLTARTQPEDIAAGFRSGANDYVTKPVDGQELRMRVAALTDLQLSIADRLRMEAAWLQAQIRPHFLFNTLNSISALIDIDVDRVRALLHVFGQYLHQSFHFHNTDQVVPLSHELELVKSYLYIEKERFGERLNVEWEADESMALWLPPLSIQPLVENALIHGILQRSRGGTVRIRISQCAEHAEIRVSDDGAGMDEEQLRTLLSKPWSESDSIGLLNIDRRLMQLYGEGLHIRSKPNEGSEVSFRIPKRGHPASLYMQKG